MLLLCAPLVAVAVGHTEEIARAPLRPSIFFVLADVSPNRANLL
jgi:hypothetical protein